MRRRKTSTTLLALAIGMTPANEEEEESLLAWATSGEPKPVAHGLYLGPVKIGYVVATRQVDTRDGDPVLIDREELFIEIVTLDDTSTTRVRSETGYSLLDDGDVLWHETVRTEGDRNRTITVRREGDEFLITDRGAGGERTRRVDAPSGTLAKKRSLSRWIDDPPEVGETRPSFELQWDEEPLVKEVLVTYLGTRRIARAGRPVEVRVIESEYRGVTTTRYQRDDGRILLGSVGGMYDFKWEPEESVRDFVARAPAFRVGEIPVDRRLGHTPEITSLRLRVDGAAGFRFPTNDRQRTVEEEGRLFLVLGPGPFVPPLRLTTDERERWLRADGEIQSDALEMSDTVDGCVDRDLPAREVGERLNRWVHEHVEPTLFQDAPTALDVLQSRAGDCTEHATLFVALARAAGLPARRVTGLVYVDGEDPVFALHAWAEFHDGDRWIQVDPTWGEMPIDATHVRLGLTSADDGWLESLPSLAFSVDAVNRRP